MLLGRRQEPLARQLERLVAATDQLLRELGRELPNRGFARRRLHGLVLAAARFRVVTTEP
jgi:hypothetical protein